MAQAPDFARTASAPGLEIDFTLSRRIGLPRPLLIKLGSDAVALLVWQMVAGVIHPTILIPSFLQVVRRGIDLASTGELELHVGASLARILVGFVIGSLVGAPLGLLMGSSRVMRDIMDPYVQFFRFVPSIAWLTPAVIWFGIGETPKILIIAYTTLFIVTLNTIVGVANVAANKRRAGAMLGARPWQSFFYIVLPASLPFILTGMRLAMANSYTAVVSAEMLGADTGLGYLISNSRLWMATDTIFLSILMLGLLGYATDVLFRTAIRGLGRFGLIA